MPGIPRPTRAPWYLRAARRPPRWALERLAHLAVRRHRPLVIGVTGSIGKTTTTQLIVAILSRRFEVGGNRTTGGAEVGNSLAALGVKRRRHAGRMPDWRSWLAGYGRGLALQVRRGDYPEVLVLEMNMGGPKSLERLTRAIAPDIGVVTHVFGEHLNTLGSVDRIAEEKSWIVRRVRPGGVAVLNADDDRVRAMSALTEERVITFGLAAGADLRAEDVEAAPSGITARVTAGPTDRAPLEQWTLESPLLGRPRISGILAALAVTRALGIPTAEQLAVVREFHGPAGRLRPIPRPDGSTVLDDSWNATAESVDSALETLRAFPGPHRVVLGEMSELGTEFEREHRRVGAEIAPWLDELVAVGDGGRLIADAAIEHGMDRDRVRCAEDTDAAVRISSGLDRDGTVLVKGSRYLGLDRVTEALIASSN